VYVLIPCQLPVNKTTKKKMHTHPQGLLKKLERQLATCIFVYCRLNNFSAIHEEDLGL
jgi:hypothetical protein